MSSTTCVAASTVEEKLKMSSNRKALKIMRSKQFLCILLRILLVLNICLSRDVSSFSHTAVFLQRYTTAHLFANKHSLNTQSNVIYDNDNNDDRTMHRRSFDRKALINAASTNSFSWNTGRSSLNQRKAMGASKSGQTTIHICTNCNCEYVKWMGRCPSCKKWNTIQEHSVQRSVQPSMVKHSLGSTTRPQSWLEGVPGVTSLQPVRISDLYSRNAPQQTIAQRQRVYIPDDNELNTVLGGGIMQGSLTLLGGDPGVGKRHVPLSILFMMSR